MKDLKEFQAAVEANGDRLKVFLDTFDHTIPADLHGIVERLDEEVWKEVDCTECARCCHTMTPTYTEEDIIRLSSHLKMSKEEFIETYLEEEEDNPEVLMHKDLPCQFLKDNKCSVYEARPDNCRSFPYHDIKPFDEYNLTFIQNLQYCPATYLLISKLEDELKRDYEWS